MALYIRLKNDFWNHRKTAKLRARIGDDALWVVPRLWSYAAESQPDGDFSKYSSEEIALLIGCSKHSTSIQQALLESGFMDADKRLHDWEEHNGYHAAFADRARKAADKRWKGHEKKGKDSDRKGDKHCLKDASSIFSIEQVIAAGAPVGVPESMATAFYNHYAAQGWVKGNGQPIRSLPHALADWKLQQAQRDADKKTKGQPYGKVKRTIRFEGSTVVGSV